MGSRKDKTMSEHIHLKVVGVYLPRKRCTEVASYGFMMCNGDQYMHK